MDIEIVQNHTHQICAGGACLRLGITLSQQTQSRKKCPQFLPQPTDIKDAAQKIRTFLDMVFLQNWQP